MKKIITLALTLVMVFSLAACGGNSDAEAGAPITVISREDGSGTRGAFTELMGITVDDVEKFMKDFNAQGNYRVVTLDPAQ